MTSRCFSQNGAEPLHRFITSCSGCMSRSIASKLSFGAVSTFGWTSASLAKLDALAATSPRLSSVLVLGHIFIAVSVQRMVSVDNHKLVRASQLGIGWFGSKFD